MISSAEADYMLEIFKQIDIDNNGWITRSELETRFQQMELDRGKVQAVMNMLDTNADGRITLDELSTALRRTNEDTCEWRQLFDEIDTDHSGYLTLDELMELFTDDQTPVPVNVVKNWMRRYDTNNDGKLSLNEFLDFVRENRL
ncbi:unnamed protein product [Calicophoron daubneyi]|uniref:EF-hand domain-containing protein n=1 Tax=Calicophoron daubneyi TaxID=300641 RepID=A0AAV2TL50_CALDB